MHKEVTCRTSPMCRRRPSAQPSATQTTTVQAAKRARGSGADMAPATNSSAPGSTCLAGRLNASSSSVCAHAGNPGSGYGHRHGARHNVQRARQQVLGGQAQRQLVQRLRAW